MTHEEREQIIREVCEELRSGRESDGFSHYSIQLSETSIEAVAVSLRKRLGPKELEWKYYQGQWITGDYIITVDEDGTFVLHVRGVIHVRVWTLQSAKDAAQRHWEAR